jgi:Rrf2 family protein
VWALLELARNSNGKPVMLRRIAEKYKLPQKYLHALLSSLKTAGLVRSIRGSQGGFVLSRKPSEISLYDIIQAVEGTLTIKECVEDSACCSRSHRCVAHQLWCKLSKIFEDMLTQISLDDMVNYQDNRISIQILQSTALSLTIDPENDKAPRAV